MEKNHESGDKHLKDTKQPNEPKVSGSKKGSSIATDKEPLPAAGELNKSKEDKQFDSQDEFIERQNNSKEED